MKKMNKLAAAMAVALTVGVASQANALIEFKSGGRGDALLFPVFNGNSGWENYYAITNDANAWIQGHIRFRGAAWTGELLDFDVILSPGDVFVFRLADIDGDGDWEIDQSLDIINFQYTGLVEVPDQGQLGLATSTCQSKVDNSTMWPCMDPSFKLIPEPDAIVNEGLIEHQKHVGYIEFIGEAVFDGMDHQMMAILLSGDPGLWEPYQTDVFTRRGTSAWKWSNAAGQFSRSPANANSVWIGDRGLSDVPNVLAGVGFVSRVGMEGVGVAFNAEAFVNFRTGQTDHRVDNYRIGADGVNLDAIQNADGSVTQTGASLNNRAIIVHHENGAASPGGLSPQGDYIYLFQEETRSGDFYESHISFNNTWGPTLADGDDYNLTRNAAPQGNVYGTKERDTDGLIKNVNLRWTAGTLGDRFANGRADFNEIDDFDQRSTNTVNSIAEVEEAIRVDGQHYTGYYFDGSAPGPNHQGKTTLQTWFFSWFPTKFFYGERSDYYDQDTHDDYLIQAVRALVVMPKVYEPQVWDIEERSAGSSTITTVGQCISPAIGPECLSTTTTIGTGELVLSEELSVFSITNIKTAFSSDTATFPMGRVVLFPLDNDPVVDAEREFRFRYSWPALMYSFEWGSDGSLAHWRALHR